MPNLLFICSKNQWRSPTAELLFKNHPVHIARSAGTSNKARLKVNEKLLLWADVIFVMEQKHHDILKKRFPLTLQSRQRVLLSIDDIYPFNHPELINILKASLSKYL